MRNPMKIIFSTFIDANWTANMVKGDRELHFRYIYRTEYKRSHFLPNSPGNFYSWIEHANEITSPPPSEKIYNIYTPNRKGIREYQERQQQKHCFGKRCFSVYGNAHNLQQIFVI